MSIRQDRPEVHVNGNIDYAIRKLNERMGTGRTLQLLRMRELYPARSDRLKAKAERIEKQQRKRR